MNSIDRRLERLGRNLPLREDIPVKHKGAWAELTACTWLLEQGYEVFRNISACGLIDIVAIKAGSVLKLDVKLKSEVSAGFSLSEAQVAGGVKQLTVCEDGACKIVTPPPIRIGDWGAPVEEPRLKFGGMTP